MIYIVGSILAIVAVTGAAAWLATSRWPARSQRWQVAVAAFSFPSLSVLLFVAAVAVTLLDASAVAERGTVGMVIFSMVYFLVYAVAGGLAIGAPTAMLAVRALRRWRRPGGRRERGSGRASPT